MGTETGLNSYYWSRDSSASIVTRVRIRRQGFDSRQRQGLSLFTTAVSRPAVGPTQPPIQCAPGGTWLGREANHSSPSSAQVKNASWRYTSTAPIRLHGVVVS
jgi:hypothetical protein